MNALYFRTLFDYNYWARDRLLAALEGLSEPEYAEDRSFTYGSIRRILTHCLDAEYNWRCRLQGMPDEADLAEVDLPTPRALAARWREEEALMRTYLAGLQDADLETDVIWLGLDGRERRLPDRWLTMAHIVNHSTQHRSEAAEALTMLGRSPGDLDLGVYAREARLERPTDDQGLTANH